MIYVLFATPIIGTIIVVLGVLYSRRLMPLTYTPVDRAAENVKISASRRVPEYVVSGTWVRVPRGRSGRRIKVEIKQPEEKPAAR